MTVDVEALTGVLAQLAVIVAAITAGVVWLRKWIRKQVVVPVATIQAELHPDQGQTLRDAIDRTERQVEALTKRYEDHLQAGHGGGQR